ncbi:MAG TPA: FtsX-like permease family protein, partial [Verrucomicrobiae bacterium]|nr:FtsX-like permease family protein [Verrucomicrobiae bacterium]
FADSPLLWMFQTGAELLTSLGGLALTLAAVGFYGLKAYLVSRRTREIGLRIALGALRRNVIWLVLKDALRLIALGLAWGLFLSYAIGQALKQMLFEVDATDPIVFLTGAGMLVLTGLFASWVPARRAAKIDPMEALRYE